MTEKIADQEFSTPGDIARCGLYLHQKTAAGNVE